jgi:hypothetical protein
MDEGYRFFVEIQGFFEKILGKFDNFLMGTENFRTTAAGGGGLDLARSPPLRPPEWAPLAASGRNRPADDFICPLRNFHRISRGSF